jgi:probable rRNA maturation factor
MIPRIESSIEDERWQDILPDHADLSLQAIEALFKQDGLPLIPRSCAELSLVLTNDNEIQALNRDYRGKDKPTNVLSFPQIDWTEKADNGQHIESLGDIVIALETMKREAEEQQKPLPHHYQHMLIHGTLHLLGFDHETDSEAKTMENLEIQALSYLKIPNPYVIK